MTSILIITPIPKLLPTAISKKIIYIKAYIKAQLIKEGEVTKQIIYILITQTAACCKPKYKIY